MGALKNKYEDIAETMAYNIVDYGLYNVCDNWREAQDKVIDLLWKKPYYMSLYFSISQSENYTEEMKNELISTIYVGLAAQFKEEIYGKKIDR